MPHFPAAIPVGRKLRKCGLQKCAGKSVLPVTVVDTGGPRCPLAGQHSCCQLVASCRACQPTCLCRKTENRTIDQAENYQVGIKEVGVRHCIISVVYLRLVSISCITVMLFSSRCAASDLQGGSCRPGWEHDPALVVYTAHRFVALQRLGKRSGQSVPL